MEVKHREKNMTYDTKSISYKDKNQNGLTKTTAYYRRCYIQKQSWSTNVVGIHLFPAKKRQPCL